MHEHDGYRAFIIKRQPARQHLIHHNAEGIKVTALVCGAVLRLLRADIVNSAHRFIGSLRVVRACRAVFFVFVFVFIFIFIFVFVFVYIFILQNCIRRCRRALGKLCYAKVHHLDSTVLEQHYILRLYIAVDDSP